MAKAVSRFLLPAGPLSDFIEALQRGRNLDLPQDVVTEMARLVVHYIITTCDDATLIEIARDMGLRGWPYDAKFSQAVINREGREALKKRLQVIDGDKEDKLT
jgi:hypothetical protein